MELKTLTSKLGDHRLDDSDDWPADAPRYIVSATLADAAPRVTTATITRAGRLGHRRRSSDN